MTEVSNYINSFPKETQVHLNKVRSFIKSIIPEAEEVMSYGIPTFNYYHNLVHFAGYERHIGFYPGAGAMKHFAKDFSRYKSGKGSVQFPLNQEIPFDLIEQVVNYRVEENKKKLLQNAKYSLCVNYHVHLKKEICPICGQPDILKDDDFSMLSNPAQRALASNGIDTWKNLAQFDLNTILSWHGIGKSAVPKIKEELDKRGLKLKSQ
jgi:uncharacterized protein YdhG (YjbR/CyaY superfamily)